VYGGGGSSESQSIAAMPASQQRNTKKQKVARHDEALTVPSIMSFLPLTTANDYTYWANCPADGFMHVINSDLPTSERPNHNSDEALISEAELQFLDDEVAASRKSKYRDGYKEYDRSQGCHAKSDLDERFGSVGRESLGPTTATTIDSSSTGTTTRATQLSEYSTSTSSSSSTSSSASNSATLTPMCHTTTSATVLSDFSTSASSSSASSSSTPFVLRSNKIGHVFSTEFITNEDVLESIRAAEEVLRQYTDQRLNLMQISRIDSKDTPFREDEDNDYATVEFVEMVAFVTDNLKRWLQKMSPKLDKNSQTTYTIPKYHLYPSTKNVCFRIYRRIGASSYNKVFLSNYPLSSVKSMRQMLTAFKERDGIKHKNLKVIAEDTDRLQLALWKTNPHLSYRTDFNHLRVVSITYDETKISAKLDPDFCTGDMSGFNTDLQLLDIHTVNSASTDDKALDVVTARSRSLYVMTCLFTGTKSIASAFSGNIIKSSTIYGEYGCTELAVSICGFDVRVTVSDNAATNTSVTKKLCTFPSFFLNKNDRQNIDPITPVAYASLFSPGKDVFCLRCPPHFMKCLWHNDSHSKPGGSKDIRKWNFRTKSLVPYDFDKMYQLFKDYSNFEGQGKFLTRGVGAQMYENALNPKMKMHVASAASWQSNKHNTLLSDQVGFVKRGRISDLRCEWKRQHGSSAWLVPQQPLVEQNSSVLLSASEEALVSMIEAQQSSMRVFNRAWDVWNSKVNQPDTFKPGGSSKVFRKPIDFNSTELLSDIRQVTRYVVGNKLAVEKQSHSITNGERLSIGKNCISSQTMECANLVGNGMAGAIEAITYEFQYPLFANLITGDTLENIFSFVKALYTVAPTTKDMMVGESKWEAMQHAIREKTIARIMQSIRSAERDPSGRNHQTRFASYDARKAANPHNRRQLQYHEAVAHGVEGSKKGNCALGCANVTVDEFIASTKLMKQRNCATASLDPTKSIVNSTPLISKLITKLTSSTPYFII
jgi:hypothetical protein